jgi:hypothetical protein
MAARLMQRNGEGKPGAELAPTTTGNGVVSAADAEAYGVAALDAVDQVK